ncbi:unnamed protein product [Prunus armeniaca]
MRNTECVNLNEQDRDGLALFLSGGNDTDHSGCYDVEDNSILERFLDPITSSAKDSTSGIVENKSRGIENLNMNGVVPLDRAIDSRKENNLTKVGSYNRFGEGTRLSSELTDYFPETSGDRYGGDGSRDLEANEAKPESFFCENKLRRFCSITNVLGFLNNIRTVYGNRVTRNYTKRFKDGEEQSHSPSCAADVSHAAQVYWCPGLLRDIHSFGYILQSVCARVFSRLFNRGNDLLCHYLTRLLWLGANTSGHRVII